MARIATLLGKDVKSGSWSSLGIAEGGEDLNKLVDLYKELRTTKGVIKRGKSEVHLSDVRLLASATGGGELKAKLKFR
jgi:hypothetical protein